MACDLCQHQRVSRNIKVTEHIGKQQEIFTFQCLWVPYNHIKPSAPTSHPSSAKICDFPAQVLAIASFWRRSSVSKQAQTDERQTRLEHATLTRVTSLRAPVRATQRPSTDTSTTRNIDKNYCCYSIIFNHSD